MHLKLLDHEATEEGKILIFENEYGETLRAKTWAPYRDDLLGRGKPDMEDFAAWIEKQDFPADMDATDYNELEEMVADFEEETGRS